MKPATTTPRTTDEEALKRIVSVAREAFARFGVHRTRMEDVAKLAGMPRQYLYRFVSGRDELIELALLERSREFSETLAAQIDPTKGHVADLTVELVVAAIELARQDEEFGYLAEAIPRVRINVLLSSSDSPVHTHVKRCLQPLLDRARHDGTLRAHVSDDAMIDWIQGIMTWLTPRTDLDTHAMTELLRTFALPALLTTSSST